MSVEGLTWPVYPPGQLDASDGAQAYNMGIKFHVLADTPCRGVRWRVPNALSDPPGGYVAAIWTVIGETRVVFKTVTPIAGGDQDFTFDTPYLLTAGTEYVVSMYTIHYVYNSTVGQPTPVSPSGNLLGDTGKLIPNNTDATQFPSSNQTAWYYISPLVDTPATVTPVTTTLTSKWTVAQRVTATLTAKWNVLQRVSSTLTSKWNVTATTTPTPTVSSGYLTAQRAATLAFIRDDPTTASFTPSTRIRTATGGFTEQDGAPRVDQTFKMSELNFDTRPTTTVAGVERLIDYHLIGRWDMTIAVGDYWFDDAGTRYDVVGFSEGWEYMTKALVSRHVPRGARP